MGSESPCQASPGARRSTSSPLSVVQLSPPCWSLHKTSSEAASSCQQVCGRLALLVHRDSHPHSDNHQLPTGGQGQAAGRLPHQLSGGLRRREEVGRGPLVGRVPHISGGSRGETHPQDPRQSVPYLLTITGLSASPNLLEHMLPAVWIPCSP